MIFGFREGGMVKGRHTEAQIITALKQISRMMCLPPDATFAC